MKRDSISIVVPGSTSNLGSGFDTLGLAVRLFNTVTIRKVDQPGVTVLNTETAAGAMATAAVDMFFKRASTLVFGVEVSWKSAIPVARGLGFSSTLRVGILAGLNELARTKWKREHILHAATELEGHPDNASPAVCGGFTVSAIRTDEVRCLRFAVSPKLALVTLIPRFAIRTEAARELMPDKFARQDAAHALNRASVITAAFAQKDYAALHGLFDDRFHQPYRQKLIPQLPRVLEAAVSAGAIGGFLSGSGSAIMCLALKNPKAVAAAMQRELPDSDVLFLKPENNGYRIK
jgi:homoserine kinase